MSQHYGISKENRKILYGFDAPTGGFFFTEFLRKDEIISEDNDVKMSMDGLNLTQLLGFLESYSIVPDVNLLVMDFATAEGPTTLQCMIGKVFGKDIMEMLKRCREDVEKYLE